MVGAVPVMIHVLCKQWERCEVHVWGLVWALTPVKGSSILLIMLIITSSGPADCIATVLRFLICECCLHMCLHRLLFMKRHISGERAKRTFVTHDLHHEKQR